MAWTLWTLDAVCHMSLRKLLTLCVLGWGSFSLYAAKKYPKAKITSVSNSSTQREYILAEAKKRGLNNVQVITCDVNNLETELRFDRIISIEMFEVRI